MLHRIPNTEPVTYEPTDTSEPIPLSHLALDLDPPSVGGWDAYLTGLGISVVTDDIGRRAIHREDARQLFTAQRDGEARQREAAAENDARLEEQRLSQLRPGVPAAAIPDGVRPAHAMLAAVQAAEPRRPSPLHEALAGDTLVYHPLNEEGAGVMSEAAEANLAGQLLRLDVRRRIATIAVPSVGRGQSFRADYPTAPGETLARVVEHGHGFPTNAAPGASPPYDPPTTAPKSTYASPTTERGNG